MRIWCNTQPNYEHKENDCPFSSALSTNAFELSTEDNRISLSPFTLVHSSSLYIRSCGAERWFICDPTGLGRLAVLDAEAIALFSKFESPTTVSSATHFMSHCSRVSIEEAITLLYLLGFLRDSTRPITTRKEEYSEVLSVWVHITNACNLRCHYCYLQKNKEKMTSDTGYKAVNAIFRSALKHRYRIVRLKYAGGEASLHIHRVIELHDYAARLAQEHGLVLEASLLSNGAALSRQVINLLKERQIAITISLDGLWDSNDSQRPLINGRGSFQLVLRAIDRLLANEIVPTITVTLTHRNLAGLPDLILYLLEHDLPFSLNYYRDNDFSDEFPDLRFADEEIIATMHFVFELIEEKLPARSLLDSLLDKVSFASPHSRTCEVGRNYLVIDQNGGIAKCQIEIGNTITTVDTDDPLKIVRQDRTGLQGLYVEEKEGCRTCDWRNWCAGGCPALTYRATGRYDVKSPNCNIYKALFPEVLRLEALRLLRYEKPLTLSCFWNMEAND